MDMQGRLQNLIEYYGTVSFEGNSYILLDDPSISNEQIVRAFAIRMDDTPDEQGRMDLYLVDWEANGEDEFGSYAFNWDDPYSVWHSSGTYNIVTGQLIPD